MKSTYFGVPCFAWVKSYFQQITITYYVWILQVDLNCYFYFFSYTFFRNLRLQGMAWSLDANESDMN